MKKQYKIQLPKGKKVTMTNVDFENGVMTVNVELENKEEPISEAEKVIKHLRSIDWDKRTKESVDRIRDELYNKKHPETISNYERWKSKFGKINNQLKEVLKHNGSKREKIEEMAKESIKELEKDCPDIWDRMINEYGEAICGKTEQKYEPKDGDFVYFNCGTIPTIAIFARTYFDCAIITYASLGMLSTTYKKTISYLVNNLRPATEEEKKSLIDKLAEKGKRWNEKEKRIEDIEYIHEDGEFVHIKTKPFQTQGYLIPSMGIDIIIKYSDGEKIYPHADSVFGNHICNTDRGYYLSDIIEIRPCTEREKKILIDKLANANKKWNPNTKQIEDVRWRAVHETVYFYIDNYFNVKRARELNERVDELRNKLGNYFKTREAAEKVAEQIREVFKNSKAE